jgi:hypothetical protein
MEHRITCSDEEFRRFVGQILPFENQGDWRFRKELRALLDGHDWHPSIRDAFDSDFNRVSYLFMRWLHRLEHARNRREALDGFAAGFLVYRCRGDDPCYDRHGQFDGIVLPFDHPFWDDHVAPNDWLCTCSMFGARSHRGAERLGGDPAKALPADWDAERTVAPEFRQNRVPGLREALEAILDGRLHW